MTINHSDEYIKYRLKRSQETFNDVKILVQSKSWNSCVNRLYYSAYYAVTALLLQHKYNTKTHSATKSQFTLHFIKTGIISKEYGKLFSDLADWRHKGDYGDLFDFKEDTVISIITPVENMGHVLNWLK